MSKKIDPDELAIFENAMRGIKRLSPKTRVTLKKQKPEKIIFKNIEEDQQLLITPNELPNDVAAEEFISFKQAAISYKTLRKLQKGQYNVDAILDLHGMTVEEAQSQVYAFLAQCVKLDLKMVLIIHGKGRYNEKPILKNKLNHWLREINVVLAFSSATPRHGSRGAIYVLLKSVIEKL